MLPGALSNSFRDSLHLDASMEEQFNQLLAGDPALRVRGARDAPTMLCQLPCRELIVDDGNLLLRV